MASLQRCDLAGNVSITLEAVEKHELDWKVSITSREGERTIEFERSGIRATGDWGLSPILACDVEAGRFYFSHPVLGFVEAYSATGNRLWRAELPLFTRFVPPQGDAKLTLKQFEKASVGGRVFVTGSFLVAEYREIAGMTRQAVFHRSGVLVGTLGPWDACVRDSVAGGWSFYSPREAPTETFETHVLDDSIDRLVVHVFAWLMPPDGAQSYAFRMCDGVPIDSIQSIVGDEYSEDDAEEAQRLVKALGAKWFIQLSRGTGLIRTQAAYRAGSPEWKEQYYRELLRAGVDVSALAKRDN